MISVVTPTLKMNEHISHNKKILSEDSRVKEFIVIEGKSPISAARQEGLQEAKSEYILWIDSDIELIKNPLDVFIRIIRESNTAGVSGISLTVPNSLFNVCRRVHEEVSQRYMPMIYESTVCMLECGLLSRKKMLEVGGFDRTMIAGEDNYIMLKLRKRGWSCVKTREVITNHYYSLRNLGKRQREYGAGLKELKKIFGDSYSIFNEYPTPNFKEKWILRIKVLAKMGKLHLLPLLPLYNLYVGQMFRKGAENESDKQSSKNS